MQPQKTKRSNAALSRPKSTTKPQTSKPRHITPRRSFTTSPSRPLPSFHKTLASHPAPFSSSTTLASPDTSSSPFFAPSRSLHSLSSRSLSALSPAAAIPTNGSPQSFFSRSFQLFSGKRSFLTKSPPTPTDQAPASKQITMPSPAARTRRNALHAQLMEEKVQRETAIIEAKKEEITKAIRDAEKSSSPNALEKSKAIRKKADLYDSGDEVDDSEEEHNKKLLRLGKFDAKSLVMINAVKKQTPLQKYLALPKHEHKIEKMKVRAKLLAKPACHLTPEDIEILRICDVGYKISKDDELEYKLWQDVKAQAFKRFSLKLDQLDVTDNVHKHLSERDRRRLLEAQQDDDTTSEEGIGFDGTEAKKIKQPQEVKDRVPGFGMDDPDKRPFSPDWSPEDYTHLLQQLWGQPENGNPDLIYMPGVKILWRQETFRKDKNGNPLPIDYNSHHLHNPYDYFDPATSTLYDPPISQFTDPEDAMRRDAYINFTMEEEIMNLRQSMTDPVELNAFDSVIVSMWLPKFYAQYIGQNDFAKPYSDRHWIYEALNHPDPEQRYIPMQGTMDSWEDFFLFDISTAPKKLKWFTAGMFGIMFGFSGLLTLEGYLATQQFFYDIEHPLH